MRHEFYINVINIFLSSSTVEQAELVITLSLIINEALIQ